MMVTYDNDLFHELTRIPLRRLLYGEWLLAENPPSAIINGGKPSKATPADKRLKENKPTKPAVPIQPIPQKKPPMKGK